MDHAVERSTPRQTRRPGRLVAVFAAIPIVAATATGCGDEEPATVEPTTPARGPAAAAGPTCEDGTLRDRRFVLCTAGDAPDQVLVVALHGRGSSAQEMRAVTGLDREAAGEGLAVVFPDGLDGGWGDDTFTAPTRPAGDEDVTFLDALIAQLRSDRRIDDAPVGLVGFSNGASMALRYAVQRPGDVRAVVSVAGQLPRDPAIRPSGPVSLLEMYGTADPVRGYDTGIPDDPTRQPGQPTPTLSTADTVAAFVAAAGSPEHDGPVEADPEPGDGTRLRTERWVGADGIVVVLRALVDGGHTWPSARAPLAGGETFGQVSRDVDATAEAIAFIVDPGAVAPS